MGLVRNVQIAWGVYKTVKGFLAGRGQEKAETARKAGALLGTGKKAEAAAQAADEVLEKAGELVHLDKSVAGVAGALALPLMRRAGRTALKGGIVLGAGALAVKLVPWYVKRKFGTPKEA